MAHIKKTKAPKKSPRSAFVKAYLPQTDVDRIHREADKKRISISIYVAQIVLAHLDSLKAARQ